MKFLGEMYSLILLVILSLLSLFSEEKYTSYLRFPSFSCEGNIATSFLKLLLVSLFSLICPLEVLLEAYP
jgi:hypothetical protein